jgi:hypothetical protein
MAHPSTVDTSEPKTLSAASDGLPPYSEHNSSLWPPQHHNSDNEPLKSEPVPNSQSSFDLDLKAQTSVSPQDFSQCGLSSATSIGSPGRWVIMYFVCATLRATCAALKDQVSSLYSGLATNKQEAGFIMAGVFLYVLVYVATAPAVYQLPILSQWHSILHNVLNAIVVNGLYCYQL